MSLPIGHRHGILMRLGRAGINAITRRHGIPFFCPHNPHVHHDYISGSASIIFGARGTALDGPRIGVLKASATIKFFQSGNLVGYDRPVVPPIGKLVSAETWIHFYQSATLRPSITVPPGRMAGTASIVFDNVQGNLSGSKTYYLGYGALYNWEAVASE